MTKNDLHPPETGLSSDPVLYGVAAGLAELFPPVVGSAHAMSDRDPSDDEDRSEQD